MEDTIYVLLTLMLFIAAIALIAATFIYLGVLSGVISIIIFFAILVLLSQERSI